MVKKIRKLVSKRSTLGLVVTMMILGGAIALFNSLNFTEDLSTDVKKITNLLLPEMLFEKDPEIIYNRDAILNDYQNKISEDFKIPDDLRSRVGFWFDIYTQYDNNHRVIHHSQFPWIVFKVVDVTPIINAETPRHRWMRNEKADKFVKEELAGIRKALTAVSKMKNLKELSEDEDSVVKALESLPGSGSVQKKAHVALKNLRIQTGQKNFFQEGLEVSPLYLSSMEEIFKAHKVPVELTRIPFVESSFNKQAVSKVGASGVWQFMGNTGRSFMIVDGHIDERHSPFKATEAAAKLLKENHMILHQSWPLAVTAWNHGPPGVRKGIRVAGSKNLADIIASYHSKSFDFASSNFYSEFLAALYAEQYQADIFRGLNPEKSLDVQAVKLSRSVPAKKLLRISGLTEDDFILFNPDLKKAVRANTAVPSGFKLMVTDSAKAGMKKVLSADKKRKTKLGQNEVSSNVSSENVNN